MYSKQVKRRESYLLAIQIQPDYSKQITIVIHFDSAKASGLFLGQAITQMMCPIARILKCVKSTLYKIPHLHIQE